MALEKIAIVRSVDVGGSAYRRESRRQRGGMSSDPMKLAQTVRSMWPVVPAKVFEISSRFYVDLGFQPHTLTDKLVEMRLGSYAFILQDYYVQQWAENFVMHMAVSDVSLWWDRIVSLDLPSRYGVKNPGAPRLEDWGLVASVIDPSGVLWRIAEDVTVKGEIDVR